MKPIFKLRKKTKSAPEVQDTITETAEQSEETAEQNAAEQPEETAEQNAAEQPEETAAQDTIIETEELLEEIARESKRAKLLRQFRHGLSRIKQLFARGSLRSSLKRKWTAILMLLVLSVLSIVGVFLLSATVNYYINQFRSQAGAVFTTDLLEEINAQATGDTSAAATSISGIIEAYSGALGIGSGREYYILDGKTGECLATSEAAFDGTVSRTANIVTAMNGEVGQSIPLFGKTMDLAIPITGDSQLVLSIVDNRSDMHHMCWLMFLVILAALVLGLLSAAALSMVLIRTVTDPIAELNQGAKKITRGEYDQVLMVQDPDEIGELTESFNEMAAFLRRSMRIAELERVRMKAVTGYLQEGMVVLTAAGEITAMNAAAQQLLGHSFTEGLTFAAVFPRLSFPDAERGIVQMVMRRGDRRMRLVFVADAERGFTVLILPLEDLS